MTRMLFIFGMLAALTIAIRMMAVYTGAVIIFVSGAIITVAFIRNGRPPRNYRKWRMPWHS